MGEARAGPGAAIGDLAALLGELFTEAEAFRWLLAPHPLLDGQTPLALIAEGRLDDVLTLLWQLREGAYL
jgi:uncharacterized protein (DUF2384 family)